MSIEKIIVFQILIHFTQCVTRRQVWDEVRLVSRSPTAGIVELKQSDGSWNKVCADEFWTTQVAEVICHHLGFSSVVKPRARRIQRKGGSFSRLQCKGSEDNIEQCNSTTVRSCRTNKEAAVICSRPREITGQPVRCSDRQYLCKRQNKCIPSRWRCDYVSDCSDGADEVNCTLYIYIYIYTVTTYSIFTATTNIPMISNYLRLLNVAGKRNEGILQLNFANQWGTICDDGFDIVAANIACKQLGFPYGAEQVKNFGRGTGQIWIDEISCLGNEKSILECRRNNFAAHDCTHAEDVGLICKTSPNPQGCGIPKAQSKNPRIVGGHASSRGKWPWLASIFLHIPPMSQQQFCAGSLVNDEWILTAAHCFDRTTDKREVRIQLGEYNLLRRDPSEQTFNVSELFIHPLYTRAAHDFDIALIKLNRPADTSTDYVNNICLPLASEGPFQDDYCFVAGWGNTGSTGTTKATILQEAKMPLLNNTICKTIYSQVTDNMMCGGYVFGGIDTCQGDSGGPLSCQRNGRWEVGGVISWGNGCAQIMKPGVYTRTKPYLQWITDTMLGKTAPSTPAAPKLHINSLFGR
ncbi:neurotrypsin-like [Ostrea edulis]|uniref:neurotrypsin-like n=1 Tax=Ostrea edulis TaxID=37623 RepID=UPI002094B313|nr:neurotrypsin-like [Ostrea edulis]